MVFSVNAEQAKKNAVMAAGSAGAVLIMSSLGVSGLLQRLPVIGDVGFISGSVGITFIATFVSGMLIDNFM